MAGLISPLQPGYSVVSLHSDIALGLVKGTLFWGIGKFPGTAPNNNKIYSSSNGTTWTERTAEASAAVSVTFPDRTTVLRFFSPVVINDLFLVLAKVSIPTGTGFAYGIVAFNGTTWSVADVTALFDESRVYAYLTYDFPLQVANSNFFLVTSTGIFKSTDGATWTESYALPAYELGGPIYQAFSVIYVSGTYYALWNNGTTTTFISSSDLSSWTAVTSLTGYFTRLFYAGGKFYAQAIYGIYESANFSSWTSRYWQAGVAFTIEPVPFGDGFFARVDRRDGSYSLNYLQYAKTTLSDFWDIPLFENNALSLSSLRVFLYNGYVYGVGDNGAFCFKYNTAWDDNNGVPNLAGTMATSERDDLVSAAGTSEVYLNTISGTLRLDTSSGPFAARNVFLYRYADGEKLAATVSNASDGTWSFSQVPPGDYFVVGVASSLDLAVPRDFDALGVITIV